MTLEERVDNLEKALGKNDDILKHLRDAVTVTAELEARRPRALKEHSGSLADLGRSRREHDERMREHDERMRELDVRIANLVSAIGAFIAQSRRNP
jgi:uncharacterized coiled-coil protein SlyX